MAALSRPSLESRLKPAEEALEAGDFELSLRRQIYEKSLHEFVRAAWAQIEPVEFVDGWHLHALCAHLEAVTRGEIRKLLVNWPPRHTKTLTATVMWPIWVWIQESDSPLAGPGVQFLCGAYSAEKAEQDAFKARKLLRTPWFEQLWGHRVRINREKDTLGQFETTAGGHRISVGMPESLGKGGLYRILDDPHKTSEVESSLMREQVLRDYDEIWSTRSNDPRIGPEVLIMQRLADNDLTGHVTQGERLAGWTWLCLPCLYDPQRHCSTSIGFEDPRGCDEDGNVLPDEERAKRADVPLWPEVWPLSRVREFESQTSTYAFASQFQQSPVPRGGSIIDPKWWRLWDRKDFPDFGTVVAGLDGAFSTKTYADFSALVVLGAYPEEDTGRPRVMLRDAWQARLSISDLVARVARTCEERKVDVLAIENKGPGISVAQEITRLYGSRRWSTVLVPVKGDKVSRVRRVEHLFEGGVIYAPDTGWADMVIQEFAAFPRGGKDNLVDAASLALNFMRDGGVALTKAEAAEEELEQLAYRKPREAIYAV